jgi:hypothetical protein
MIFFGSVIMGQTQLLLIVLGVLLVGLAIYVGSTMFSANAEENSRAAMINDLSNFAQGARIWYNKPVSQGGGGKSFTDITIGKVFPMVENENARYRVASASDNLCIIEGVGKIVTSNADSIRVRVRITPERNTIEIVQ